MSLNSLEKSRDPRPFSFFSQFTMRRFDCILKRLSIFCFSCSPFLLLPALPCFLPGHIRIFPAPKLCFHHSIIPFLKWGVSFSSFFILQAFSLIVHKNNGRLTPVFLRLPVCLFLAAKTGDMVYLSYRYSQTKRTYKQEHKEHNLSAAACALLTAVCCLPAHITAAGGAALSDRRF